ncbi:MAG: hypothetical protein U1D35_04185 [Paracoccaceae bacterium]|nr:hypothetical protein [Paracoccaceae bacterium]
MRRAVVILLLAACSPQEMADKVARRAATSVVLPVVNDYMPGPQAEGVTLCVIDNASAQEINSLARDVAVEAGSSTAQTVLAIARRPDTLSCILGAGLPPISG